MRYVDLLFPHYGELASRLGAVGAAPPTTMLGVTRLAIPGQMVELEGTAVACGDLADHLRTSPPLGVP